VRNDKLSFINDTSAGDAFSSIFQDNVEGVDDAGDPTKDGQKDVDEEVCIATPFEEHTERWQEDGKEDLNVEMR